MKILVDKNIPHVYTLFGFNNTVVMRDGRCISSKDVKDTDMLIIRSVTRVDDILLDGSSVEFVGTVTAGTDHVDEYYLNKCGINFAYAPGNNAIAVVEYVFTALFWLARRDGFFLRDKVVGIVGFGHVGSLLYKRLCSFGIHALLCDPILEKFDTNKPWQSLETLVSEVDILTLHTPLVYNGDYPTWHMIDINVLEALIDNCILINTSRGSVIDNSALLTVLEQGKNLTVVLDVWETEPEISLPLLSCIDIGTAHIAGYTYESKIRGIMQIYNEYCNVCNIDFKRNLSLLNSSVTYDILIREKIDEILLSKLVNFAYNIRYDDSILRHVAAIPGGFDKIRRYYLNRREWSALNIKTYIDVNNETLMNLGFGVF